ncbi:nitrogen regulation protein NtrC [Vibrio astriarenae]|nr:nitrogen regulation protein NtrC [Vibrio sp. C7]
MSKGYVWVVDDDSSIRWVMEKTLSSANIRCETFADAESVLLALERETPDVLVSDIRMPGIDGIELLQQIQSQSPDLPVIIMTAHSDLDAAVNAYQKGAFEYLPKPFDVDETLSLVERALAHRQEQRQESMKEELDTSTPEIIGEAPAMQEVFRAIGRYRALLFLCSSMVNLVRVKSWWLMPCTDTVLVLKSLSSPLTWQPSLKT